MPSLDLRFRLKTSALLRRRVDDDGFDCYRSHDDYDGEGDDAVELAELDARETAVARDLSTAAATGFFDEHPEFRDWSEDRLRAREIEPTLERQAACGLVARSLAATMMALHEGSLEPPRRTQRMYAAHPDLFERLSARDRLLPLTGESFDTVDRQRDPDLFLAGGQLVGFHPWLLNWPELVEALRGVAETPGLRVWVAADPDRLPVPNVSRWRRLREEQLWGVRLTAGNVDSLDPKDQSSSFHAPLARHPLLDYSDPVLGTWIHARAEPPRRIFYVQEVLPADHEPYVHAGMLRIRALHSERDTGSRAFTHVDGKIESYPVADWRPSRDAPSARLGSPSAKRKLWRVDAADGMRDDDWSRLVGGFYRRNELVAEHFDALGTQPVAA